MKNLLSGLILIFGLGISGLSLTACNSTQTQTVKNDIAKVLEGAIAALNTLNNNPAAIADAEAALSALAAVVPQTGPVHQAIIDAQAALNALQRGQGTLAAVQDALQAVVNRLENQGAVPLGRYHTR